MDMRTSEQEVPMDRWMPFFAEFTRENRGAHARVETIAPTTEIRYLVEAEDRPFDGVAADTKDGESTVWISFGSANDNIAHSVHRATRIYAAPHTAKGATLEIESADGAK